MNDERTILIVGGSLGGLTAAFELEHRLGERARVAVLDNHKRLVFIPSSPARGRTGSRSLSKMLHLENALRTRESALRRRTTTPDYECV